jgi:DnaJ family protein A protein 5
MNSNGNDDSYAQESSSQNFEENGGKENEQVGRDKKISNQPVDKKGTSKDTKTKANISSKGKKAKV